MGALATHSGQLERWLGKAEVERVSASMRDWYGPPIAVAGVPGKVWAHKGGDFRGRISEGRFASYIDHAEGVLRRFPRAFDRWARRQVQEPKANMPGFSSLSDLISEATVAGKMQRLQFQKAGPTKVVGSSSQLWQVGAWPPAGSNGGAAPGGTVHTSSTTGAIPMANVAVGGDFASFVGAMVTASLQQTYLLYDRLFSVAKTINSTATEAVTGVPTRYQNTTLNQPDSVGGNFLFICTGLTALANTAHNWTVCQYTNHAGTAGQSMPSLAGNPGAVATITHRFDMPVGTWFAPLVSGDIGIKALTQMQCSALVATGIAEFVIGHPIAWLPAPLANIACQIDGINTAFNLTRIFDNACLSLLEVAAPAVTATNVFGTITTVAG